jgi:hypothetical protein
MKLVTTKFKSGGLHEKHAVATMTKINYIPTITIARVGNHIHLGAPVYNDVPSEGRMRN